MEKQNFGRIIMHSPPIDLNNRTQILLKNLPEPNKKIRQTKKSFKASDFQKSETAQDYPEGPRRDLHTDVPVPS